MKAKTANYLAIILTAITGFVLGQVTEKYSNIPKEEIKNLAELQREIAKQKTIPMGTRMVIQLGETRIGGKTLPTGLNLAVMTTQNYSETDKKFVVVSKSVSWQGETIIPLGTKLWVTPNKTIAPILLPSGESADLNILEIQKKI